ncbi:MAG TPA: hypothetical protein VH351_19215 [Bryobacteraceae bacterium]|jgi:hypothetical protein|nr:hypothetical protein [Bryobacteraceae bacterium]
MRRLSLVLFPAVFAIQLFAQVPVASAPEPVGSPRGDDWHGYNIVDSFEAGYRFASVSGNEDQYRATVNFGNGIRLFDTFFSMDSKAGKGALFDKLIATTNGMGDPYSSATLRVEKNRIYEYDFSWRKNDYLNPGLTTDGGQENHLLDTTYTLQDHDLTLFPQSRIRILLGYTHDDQQGTGLSTVQLYQTNSVFDNTGDIFPIFTNIKRSRNEYRLGAEVRWYGFVFNVLHGWQDFKDDTPYQQASLPPDLEPSSAASLTSFSRTGPAHGTAPYWRVMLIRDARWLSLNGRFTYTGGTNSFLTDESAIGTNRFGAAANQQILSFGEAHRPVATGNLDATLFPTPKLTIANRFAFYNVRTQGDASFLQFNNDTQVANLVNFQYLGIRTIEAGTDLQYQLLPWMDVRGGYDYSDRRIGSSPQYAIAGITSGVPYIQTNILNDGRFGIRLRPIKPLTIIIDGDIGHANLPFTPKSDRNYNAFSGRVQYKLKSVQLLAFTKTDYNSNSISLTSYSSHARTYSGSGSWTPRSWASLDLSYSKIHLDTLGGIDFFANDQFFANQLSYYVSNIHSVVLSSRLSYKRMEWLFAYSLIRDTGDGRSNPSDTSIGPSIPAFQLAQTFPLSYQSPSARLSIRINERVRWNAGYQYFGYHEDFTSGENYHANTGYTSLSWSF